MSAGRTRHAIWLLARRRPGPTRSPLALPTRRRARALRGRRSRCVRLDRRRLAGHAAYAARSFTSSTSARSPPQGTFDGAIDRLAHLVELGVDAVELMPVAEFSGERGWGYDGVDLFAPAPRATAARPGSSGSSTPATPRGSESSSTSSTTTSGRRATTCPSSGPTSPTRHHDHLGRGRELRRSGQRRGPAIRRRQRRDVVRDYHVDGLRLDAVHAIVDDSPVHILEELADAVHARPAHVRPRRSF